MILCFMSSKSVDTIGEKFEHFKPKLIYIFYGVDVKSEKLLMRLTLKVSQVKNIIFIPYSANQRWKYFNLAPSGRIGKFQVS